MSRQNQIALNYTYLGVIFTLTQFFDNLYAIRLLDKFTLNGGDIAYTALIFTALYLIISQPKQKVVRNLLYIFLINTLFLFLLFTMLHQILLSVYIINYLQISNEFLQFSYKSLIFSLFLITSEILLILFLVNRFTEKYQSQKLVTTMLSVIYCLVVIVDGIVYPIGINILLPNSNFSVVNGIIAKLIFGTGFGILLFILLNLRPRNLPDFINNRFLLLNYLIPPEKVILQQQLVEAEEKIEELKKIIPICAWCKKIRDDEEYWDQVENFIDTLDGTENMVFSHGICPKCQENRI